MLQEHLNDWHDSSSHRPTLIDAEVKWIHREILEEVPSHILDLCSGPEFHTQNLAVLRHQCTGADFSPAWVEYVRALTQSFASPKYIEADILTTDLPINMDLVMILLNQYPGE